MLSLVIKNGLVIWKSSIGYNVNPWKIIWNQSFCSFLSSRTRLNKHRDHGWEWKIHPLQFDAHGRSQVTCGNCNLTYWNLSNNISTKWKKTTPSLQKNYVEFYGVKSLFQLSSPGTPAWMVWLWRRRPLCLLRGVRRQRCSHSCLATPWVDFRNGCWTIIGTLHMSPTHSGAMLVIPVHHWIGIMTKEAWIFWACNFFTIYYSILQLPALRLALLTVLKMIPNGLVLLAPQCSSWVVASRGTSRRSIINPQGFLGYDFVRHGNKIMSRLVVQNHSTNQQFLRYYRLVLMLMVVQANNLIYVVENPAGTLIWEHNRFSQFCNMMAWAPCLQFTLFGGAP